MVVGKISARIIEGTVEIKAKEKEEKNFFV
jgi:hypothetical protein